VVKRKLLTKIKVRIVLLKGHDLCSSKEVKEEFGPVEALTLSLLLSILQIDGILFFHKKTSYTFGPTPLVVLLKPYMLPEMLEVEVSETLLAERPDSYSNYAAHLEYVAERKKNSEARLQKRKTHPKWRSGGGEDWEKQNGERSEGQGCWDAQRMDAHQDFQPERVPNFDTMTTIPEKPSFCLIL
jgi:hypothetical protein